jgi:lysophospholipase L1-like esterase
MPPALTARKKLLFMVTVPLVAGLVFLLLLEGAARVYTSLVPQPAQSALKFRLRQPPPYQNADYFSKAFVKESFIQPGGWRIDPSFGWIPNDYHGVSFNVVEAKRVTTDPPPRDKVKTRLLLFGGSTAYCSEVPDRFTIASILQRLLNDATGGTVQVENYGATSITIRQQLVRLKGTPLRAGDRVVFYDGVNDVLQSVFYRNPDGYILGESKRMLTNMPPLARLVFKLHGRLSPYSELAALVLNPARSMSAAPPAPFDESLLVRLRQDFASVLKEADQYCRSQGATFTHFLQPNLFSSPPQTAYELTLLANPWLVPAGVGAAFQAGQPVLREVCAAALKEGQLGADLSDCLQKHPGEIFLDFCHVNHAGNELVARAMLASLQAAKPATPP